MTVIALFSWAGLGVAVEQLLVGLSLGMVMCITLAVVDMAGEVCGMQMGLGFPSFFPADSNTNNQVLSRFLNLVTILMFLALDGHLMVLALPMVGALLIINLTMGIINRVALQLTVFSMGFPAPLSVGLLFLMVGDLGQFLAFLVGHMARP